MAKRPFIQRLYFEPVLFESARIIGYGGVDMAAFWKAAKKLRLPQNDILNAVSDLTGMDKREANPPRYELREDVRRLRFGLLGPARERPWRKILSGKQLAARQKGTG